MTVTGAASSRPLLPGCALFGLAFAVAGCDSGTGPDSVAPVALVVEAGDDQVAAAGQPAPVDPLVKVVGASGAGLAGATVAFRVVLGGGSVQSAEAVTGADGTASPGRWTLGAKGRQRLEASVAGLASVFFNAGASGVAASISVVAGDGQRGEVASAVAVAPEVRVQEAGGAPAPFVPVTFAADQGQVGRALVYTGEDGRASAESWTLGPAAGPQQLIAGVAGSGIENNPVVFRATATPSLPSRFTLSPGATAPEVERYYWPPATVRVEDAHGNGVPWVAVGLEAGGGGRVQDSVVYTDGRGAAAVGRWIMGPAAGARNTLTATILSVGAPATGNSATIAAVAQAADFDIEVHHLSEPRPALAGALEAARETWESAIKADVLGPYWLRQSVGRCFADPETTLAGWPERFVIDDHLVFSLTMPVDGAGGTIARSGWCWALTDRGEVWPAISVVVFDEADVAAMSPGTLADLTRHHLAHALGFGTTLWNQKRLLSGGAGAPEGLRFNGSEAEAAFESLGGGASSGTGVPLDPRSERDGNMHWRASVFGPELLTEVLRVGQPNPLSVVTLASMRDSGWKIADYGAADDYALPNGGSGQAGARLHAERRGGAESGLGAQHGDARRTRLEVLRRAAAEKGLGGQALWLGDDGLALPRLVRDAATGAVRRADGSAGPLRIPVRPRPRPAAERPGRAPDDRGGAPVPVPGPLDA